MADTEAQVRPVDVGDAVRVVDEHYVEHVGLVTAVHGKFGQTYDTADGGTRTHVPCINVVCISADSAKTDPYGRQVERMSSLQHLSQGPDQMPNPGRYWENL